MDMDVSEDESTKEKVMKLTLAVTKQKDKISAVQFKYEIQISEL